VQGGVAALGMVQHFAAAGGGGPKHIKHSWGCCGQQADYMLVLLAWACGGCWCLMHSMHAAGRGPFPITCDSSSALPPRYSM
jgi:hypothetical protein